MARTTYVKRAQQRYEMVPVTGADGKPVRTPVMRKDGTQKTTKSGRPVFKTQTVADKTKPLPPEKCGKCGKEILPGTPYKWIAPKSGPYGGRRLVRCDDCPTWQVWEYSSSLSARVAQMENTCTESINDAESPDDVREALTAMADEVRSLAEEKREGASNIEDGFGHSTQQSDELNQQADDLDSWADEIEQADVPETDDYGCQTCMGEGTVDCDECEEGTVRGTDGTGTGTCENCNGTGQVECDECEAEEDYVDLDAWRSAVMDDVSIISECPV